MSVFASPPYVSPRPGLCGMRSASAKLLINFKYPKLFSFSSSVSVIRTYLCLTILRSIASLSRAPHCSEFKKSSEYSDFSNSSDFFFPSSLSPKNSLSKKNELQPKAAAHPYIMNISRLPDNDTFLYGTIHFVFFCDAERLEEIFKVAQGHIHAVDAE